MNRRRSGSLHPEQGFAHIDVAEHGSGLQLTFLRMQVPGLKVEDQKNEIEEGAHSGTRTVGESRWLNFS
jgi:hypothetical protein